MENDEPFAVERVYYFNTLPCFSACPVGFFRACFHRGRGDCLQTNREGIGALRSPCRIRKCRTLCRQSWLIFLLPRTRLFILDCWSSCLRKSVPEIWLSVPAPLSDAPMREIDGSHFSLLRFPAAQYRAVSALSIGRTRVEKIFHRANCPVAVSSSPYRGSAICHAVMSGFSCFPHAPSLIARSVEVDCAFPRFGPINRANTRRKKFFIVRIVLLQFRIPRATVALSAMP